MASAWVLEGSSESKDPGEASGRISIVQSGLGMKRALSFQDDDGQPAEKRPVIRNVEDVVAGGERVDSEAPSRFVTGLLKELIETALAEVESGEGDGGEEKSRTDVNFDEIVSKVGSEVARDVEVQRSTTSENIEHVKMNLRCKGELYQTPDERGDQNYPHEAASTENVFTQTLSPSLPFQCQRLNCQDQRKGILLGYLDQDQANISFMVGEIEKHFKLTVQRAQIFRSDDFVGMFVGFQEGEKEKNLKHLAVTFRETFAFPNILGINVGILPETVEKFKAAACGTCEEQFIRQYVGPEVGYFLRKLTEDHSKRLRVYIREEGCRIDDYDYYRVKSKGYSDEDSTASCECGECEKNMISSYLNDAREFDEFKKKIREKFALVTSSNQDVLGKMLKIMKFVGNHLDSTSFGSNCAIIESCEEELMKYLTTVTYGCDLDLVESIVDELRTRVRALGGMYSYWDLERFIEIAKGWRRESMIQEPGWLVMRRMNILLSRNEVSEAESIARRMDGKGNHRFLMCFFLSLERLDEAYDVVKSGLDKVGMNIRYLYFKYDCFPLTEEDCCYLEELLTKISETPSLGHGEKFKKMLRIFHTILKVKWRKSHSSEDVVRCVSLFLSFLEVFPASDLPEDEKDKLLKYIDSSPKQWSHSGVEGLHDMLSEMLSFLEDVTDPHLFVADLVSFIFIYTRKAKDEWKIEFKIGQSRPLLTFRLKVIESWAEGNDGVSHFKDFLMKALKMSLEVRDYYVEEVLRWLSNDLRKLAKTMSDFFSEVEEDAASDLVRIKLASRILKTFIVAEEHGEKDYFRISRVIKMSFKTETCFSAIITLIKDNADKITETRCLRDMKAGIVVWPTQESAYLDVLLKVVLSDNHIKDFCQLLDLAIEYKDKLEDAIIKHYVELSQSDGIKSSEVRKRKFGIVCFKFPCDQLRNACIAKLKTDPLYYMKIFEDCNFDPPDAKTLQDLVEVVLVTHPRQSEVVPIVDSVVDCVREKFQEHSRPCLAVLEPSVVSFTSRQDVCFDLVKQLVFGKFVRNGSLTGCVAPAFGNLLDRLLKEETCEWAESCKELLKQVEAIYEHRSLGYVIEAQKFIGSVLSVATINLQNHLKLPPVIQGWKRDTLRYNHLKCGCQGCVPLFAFLQDRLRRDTVITVNQMGRRCIMRILNRSVTGNQDYYYHPWQQDDRSTVAQKLKVTFSELNCRENGGRCGGVKISKQSEIEMKRRKDLENLLQQKDQLRQIETRIYSKIQSLQNNNSENATKPITRGPSVTIVEPPPKEPAEVITIDS